MCVDDFVNYVILVLYNGLYIAVNLYIEILLTGFAHTLKLCAM